MLKCSTCNSTFSKLFLINQASATSALNYSSSSSSVSASTLFSPQQVDVSGNFGIANAFIRREKSLGRDGRELLPCRNQLWNGRKFYSTKYRSGIILGIETSCDDTGVAVVNHEKKVLGESLNAQLQIHLNHGGVIPPIAQHLHEQHIGRVIEEALAAAKITLNDVDAIATTVKPGLALSLKVGVKRGKELCIKAKKPFIPIHHMEAHALTPRMLGEIEFPYMVLLISGGHCLLAVAKGINDFLLLGRTIDDAPGEAFDKTARRLKLHNKSDASSISGGEAIERYAKKGNPEIFRFPTPMNRYRDCNWSFAGLKFIAQRHILWEERKYEVDGSDLIPSINDLCASFQHAVVEHLCKKIERGMIFADMKKLIGDSNRKLIVSGGVACNNYIKRGIELVCKEFDYQMIVPPNELCTDNGTMIAWNGVEKWNEEIDIIPVEDLESVDIEPKAPFGVDMYQEIRKLDIKCKRISMTQLFTKDDKEDEQVDQSLERERVAKKFSKCTLM